MVIKKSFDTSLSERIAKAVYGHFEYYIYNNTSFFSLICESPIEVMLGVGFFAAWNMNYSFMPPLRISSEEVIHQWDRKTILVIPQYQVADLRRIDFLILGMNGNEEVRIAVECDGHDFHERTKEQAANDRFVDRQLQAAGYHVMRFTGSEIYNSLHHVTEELANFLTEKLGGYDPTGGRK